MAEVAICFTAVALNCFDADEIQTSSLCQANIVLASILVRGYSLGAFRIHLNSALTFVLYLWPEGDG